MVGIFYLLWFENRSVARRQYFDMSYFDEVQTNMNMKSFVRSFGFCAASVSYSLYSIRKSKKSWQDHWGLDPINLILQMGLTLLLFAYICSNTCFEYVSIGTKICEPSFIWFQMVFSLQDRILNVVYLAMGDHMRIGNNLFLCGLHKVGVAFALWYLWDDRFEQIFTMLIVSHISLFWHLKTAKELMMLVHQGKLGRPIKVEE